MKRMHIHLAVQDLSNSIQFYSTLFGNSPSVQRDDYAKWHLDDPRVNFAVSTNGKAAGLDHLGIQVESEDELESIVSALTSAEIESSEEQGESCCYANSHKHWVLDPQRIAWEAFVTYGESDTNCAGGVEIDGNKVSCCIPTTLGKAQNKGDEEKCCIPNPGSSCCN